METRFTDRLHVTLVLQNRNEPDLTYSKADKRQEKIVAVVEVHLRLWSGLAFIDQERRRAGFCGLPGDRPARGLQQEVMKNLLSQVVSRDESATKLAAWIERAQA